MAEQLEPMIFVVLGGTGDLMQRKLLPALYNLAREGNLPDNYVILGAARNAEHNDESFRKLASESLAEAGLSSGEDHWCESCLYYQSIDKQEPQDYENLARRI